MACIGGAPACACAPDPEDAGACCCALPEAGAQAARCVLTCDQRAPAAALPAAPLPPADVVARFSTPGVTFVQRRAYLSFLPLRLGMLPLPQVPPEPHA